MHCTLPSPAYTPSITLFRLPMPRLTDVGLDVVTERLFRQRPLVGLAPLHASRSLLTAAACDSVCDAMCAMHARFVDVDLDVAMERVFRRQTANGTAPEVSRGRISGNDRPNGEAILQSKPRAAVLVPSGVPFRDTAHA